ncbi:unnamed protein product [Owenia fusiformis]|uniref:Uncharacterized protein n=1 Tax=Owenia fusiformis TaxID=6347 RepID=A0A8S4PWD4_OWEFU|nr:unnamed protein product [Owenia fusiformis]
MGLLKLQETPVHQYCQVSSHSGASRSQLSRRRGILSMCPKHPNEQHLQESGLSNEQHLQESGLSNEQHQQESGLSNEQHQQESGLLDDQHLKENIAVSNDQNVQENVVSFSHSIEGESPHEQPTKWDPKTHTIPVDTDAFGDIVFSADKEKSRRENNAIPTFRYKMDARQTDDKSWDEVDLSVIKGSQQWVCYHFKRRQCINIVKSPVIQVTPGVSYLDGEEYCQCGETKADHPTYKGNIHGDLVKNSPKYPLKNSIFSNKQHSQESQLPKKQSFQENGISFKQHLQENELSNEQHLQENGLSNEQLLQENGLSNEQHIQVSEPPDGQHLGENVEVSKERNVQENVVSDNHLIEEHEQLAKWDPKTHTIPVDTDAFGDIVFSTHKEKSSRYIRLDYLTEIKSKKVIDDLMYFLKLEKPSLVISVTGGAKNFNMKPRQMKVFRSGLVKATRCIEGAWIITGGMHSGVMKYVGEAVHANDASADKKKVTCIGIAPLGCVSNQKRLLNKNHQLHRSEPVARYECKDNPPRKECFLDLNHSHFILVDNGTRHQFGTEIEFRAEFENAVCKRWSDPVPLVCVVVEGGPGTLETVKCAMEQGSPVVIIEGSGRAADILAYAYSECRNSKSGDGTVTINDEHRTDLRGKIIAAWGDRNVDKHMGWLFECISMRELITVVTLDDHSQNSIDSAILEAVLKTKSANKLDQLNLALGWNRIDLAKQHIFDEHEWKDDDLWDMMYKALLNDRTDFVRLFIDHGLDLKKFVTRERMEKLYTNKPDSVPMIEKKFNLCQTLIKKRLAYWKKLQKIKPGGRKSIKLSSPSVFSNVPLVINALMGDFYTYPQYVDDGDKDKDAIYYEQPARELFMWSVLMNREELAVVFWDEGNDGIAAALTASKILKELGYSCVDDYELQADMRKNSKLWGERALSILMNCYISSEVKAQKLLMFKQRHFGGDTTILELAVQTKNKEFVSHSCCQSLLSKIWTGKLSQDNHKLKLLLCTLIPPLLFFFVKYEKKETKCGDVAYEEVELDEINGNTTNKIDNKNSRTDDTDSERQRPMLTRREKLSYFYNAPYITFIHNFYTQVVFLLLFSYLLLIQFKPTCSYLEIVIIAWVVTITAEEIRQARISKHYHYLGDCWNWLDIINIGLFFLAVVLRFLPFNKTFEAARVTYAFDLVTFYIRLLNNCSTNTELGPKIVMINKMIIDVGFFLIILSVFTLAYGISSHSILYPNAPSLSWDLFVHIILKPYWQMYGELDLEDLERGDHCNSNGTSNIPELKCPTQTGTYIIPWMLAVYMLFTNVLMINLLIAMFSYTFNKIRESHDIVSKFQWYHFVREYTLRPPVPPPFIILVHFYQLMRFVAGKCNRHPETTTCWQRRSNKFEVNSDDAKSLREWENMICDEFMRAHKREHKESIYDMMKTSTEEMMCTNGRLDSITSRLEVIEELLDTKQNHLEGRLNEISRLLQHLTKRENKPDVSKPPIDVTAWSV